MNVELKAVSIFVDILDSLEILIIYSSSNPLNPKKNLTTHPSRPRLLYFCLLKTRYGHLTFLLYIFLQEWMIVFFRKKIRKIVVIFTTSAMVSQVSYLWIFFKTNTPNLALSLKLWAMEPFVFCICQIVLELFWWFAKLWINIVLSWPLLTIIGKLNVNRVLLTINIINGR